jgi:hypothetical protein
LDRDEKVNKMRKIGEMRKIGVLTLMAFLMLLPVGVVAVSDPDEQYPGQLHPPDWLHPPDDLYTPDGQYPGQEPFADVHSTSLPSEAPVPAAPSSPESLGLKVPSETSAPLQAPRPGENEETMLYAAEGPARSPAPEAQFSDQTVMRMILPPGGSAFNRFYVPYVPQTIASCSIYGWLPTWLQVSSSGPVWGYEWYPGGWLNCQFLGYASPGWHKRWFYGDDPGWHILQYYCNGWSNYIYVYVHGWGPGPGPWTPSPDPWPWWSSHHGSQHGSSHTGMTDRVTGSGRGINTITSSGGGLTIRSSTTFG